MGDTHSGCDAIAQPYTGVAKCRPTTYFFYWVSSVRDRPSKDYASRSSDR